MNFLVYIEFSAENLQFYLWFRDYVKRFNNLPEVEKSLAPPVDPVQLDAETLASPKSPRFPKVTTREVEAAFKGTGFASSGMTSEKTLNPFDSYSIIDSRNASLSEDGTTLKSSRRADHKVAAANAFETADIKVQPCK